MLLLQLCRFSERDNVRLKLWHELQRAVIIPSGNAQPLFPTVVLFFKEILSLLHEQQQEFQVKF